jgi:tetratricopeptide (TPR) repeat protein
LREGQERLDRVLRASASAPPALRAKALSGLGVLLEATGDYDRAKTCHEEALALFRDVGDEPGIAEALENLGIIASNEGDLARSRSIREEVLALRRAIGDQRGIAVALINLGNVDYVEKDSDGAIALYEEARELAVKTGSQWTLSMALANLGGALIQKARGGETDPTSVAEMEAQGLEHIRESLRISRGMGDRERILESLLMLADIAAPNDPRQAATLLGAADALAGSSEHQIASADPDQYARVVATVRAGLDEAAFDAAWHEGERQALDDLLTDALGSTQPIG